jgi:hypothetical protein
MKRPKEVLDTIAVNNGHRDWLELTHCEGPITILNCTIEAMELYASQSNSHKHVVSGKRPDFDAMIKALEQMPDDKLDKLIQQVEAACGGGAVDTVAARGTCENECTGPWDCQCQDVINKFYRGIERKSSDGQL